jgi:hypothetical protein
VTEPTVDGVPISDIIKIEDNHYCRAEATSVHEFASRKSYTVFVKYVHDPDDAREGYSIEEIDVKATDRVDARIIAELALTWHYQSGGEIVEMRENIPGITYF